MNLSSEPSNISMDDDELFNILEKINVNDRYADNKVDNDEDNYANEKENE